MRDSSVDASLDSAQLYRSEPKVLKRFDSVCRINANQERRELVVKRKRRRMCVIVSADKE